jgi:deoxyribonuclease V
LTPRIREAIALQRRLARRVRLRPLAVPEIAIGLDASYGRGDRIGWAAAVVVRRADLLPVRTSTASAPVRFPYVPGLLSFRELPLLRAALRRLPLRGAVLLVDGQGIAHPRRFGIASHLGVLLGVPSIGVAKSFLAPGAAAVRLGARAKPVYVSPGHLCDVASAVRIVRAFSAGYRLPEPTRLAHHAVGAARRAAC